MSWTWSAWIMMALTVGTSSLAGAECIGTEVKLDKGEAVLRCPLPVDVSATRGGMIVKHFPTPDSRAGVVLECDWPPEVVDKPECKSLHGFSLVGPLTDQVVVKVPLSRLMDNGTYKVQLYPLDGHFTPCHIHRFGDNGTADDVLLTNEDQRSAVTPTTPVVSSTAADRSAPDQDPLIRKAPPCEGQSRSVELMAAVLVLQIFIFILVPVNILAYRAITN